MYLKNKLKIISIFTITLFFFNNLSNFSYAINLNSKTITQSFKIDKQIGQVIDSFNQSNKPNLYIIEDLHCNKEVQLKIKKILSKIKETEGSLDILGIEGSYDILNLGMLREIDNFNFNNKENIAANIKNILLEKGYLTGAELYGIDNPNTKLIGIEDENIYKNNFKMLYKSLSYRKLLKNTIEKTFDTIERGKEILYTEDLKEIENYKNKYENNEIILSEYLEVLIDLDSRKQGNNENNSVIARNNKDVTWQSQYPTIKLYLELQELSKNLNLNKVKFETKSIVKAISKLSQTDNTVIAKSETPGQSNQNYKEEYYLHLKNILKQNKISYNKNYKEFTKYMKYLELKEEINLGNLIKEKDNLELELKLTLSNNIKDLEDLVYFERYLSLFKGYINNELSKEEVELWNTSKIDFFKILEDLGNRLSTNNTLLNRLKDIYTALDYMDNFYRFAEKRNEILVKNIMDVIARSEAPRQSNPPVTAMIVGGFHRTGITEILRAKGVNHIVIRPNTTKVYDNNIYLERIQEQALLLDLESKEKSFTYRFNNLADKLKNYFKTNESIPPIPGSQLTPFNPQIYQNIFIELKERNISFEIVENFLKTLKNHFDTTSFSSIKVILENIYFDDFSEEEEESDTDDDLLGIAISFDMDFEQELLELCQSGNHVGLHTIIRLLIQEELDSALEGKDRSAEDFTDFYMKQKEKIKQIIYKKIRELRFGNKSLLQIAIFHGHLKSVRALVNSYGFSFNLPDPETQNTPFQEAIIHQRVAIVEFFCKSGADIYHENIYGKNAIYLAEDSSNLYLIELVLSLLRSNIQAFDMAREGNIDDLKAFSYTHNIRYLKDENGKSLYYHAVKNKNILLLDMLIERKVVVDDNLINDMKETDRDALYLLLPHHPSISIFINQIMENIKRKVRNQEALVRELEVLNNFIENFDPNCREILLNVLRQVILDNCLLEFSLLGDLHKVKLVMRNGATLEIRDKTLNTPLQLAAANGHFPVVRFLCTACSADVNSQDIDGFTPVHLALTKENNNDVIQFLLSNGEIDFTLTTEEHGFSILAMAFRKLNFRAVHTIIKKYPNMLFRESFETINLSRIFINDLEKRKDYIRLLKYVIKNRKLDVNATNSEGITILNLLLDVITNMESPDIIDLIQFMLSNGFDLTSDNKVIEIALNKTFPPNIVLYLLGNGAPLSHESRTVLNEYITNEELWRQYPEQMLELVNNETIFLNLVSKNVDRVTDIGSRFLSRESFAIFLSKKPFVQQSEIFILRGITNTRDLRNLIFLENVLSHEEFESLIEVLGTTEDLSPDQLEIREWYNNLIPALAIFCNENYSLSEILDNASKFLKIIPALFMTFEETFHRYIAKDLLSFISNNLDSLVFDEELGQFLKRLSQFYVTKIEKFSIGDIGKWDQILYWYILVSYSTTARHMQYPINVILEHFSTEDDEEYDEEDDAIPTPGEMFFKIFLSEKLKNIFLEGFMIFQLLEQPESEFSENESFEEFKEALDAKFEDKPEIEKINVIAKIIETLPRIRNKSISLVSLFEALNEFLTIDPREKKRLLKILLENGLTIEDSMLEDLLRSYSHNEDILYLLLRNNPGVQQLIEEQVLLTVNRRNPGFQEEQNSRILIYLQSKDVFESIDIALLTNIFNRLIYTYSLIYYSSLGNVDPPLLEHFILTDRIDLNHQNHLGKTAIHELLESENYELLGTFFIYGANFLLRDLSGLSPLDLIYQTRDKDLIERVADYQRKVDQVFSAVRSGNVSEAKRVIINTPINTKSIKDHDNRSVLHYPVASKDFNMVKLLVEEFEYPIGFDTLEESADNPPLLYYLLSREKYLMANFVNAQVEELVTNEEPLEILRSLETSAFILQYILNFSPETRETVLATIIQLIKDRAILESARRGNLDRLKFLETHGANLEARDFGGETPLFLAVRENENSSHQALIEYLVPKVNIDCLDSEGTSLVHMVCGSGDIEVLELLLTHTVDLYVLNSTGLGLLAILARSAFLDGLRIILTKDPELMHHETPLGVQGEVAFQFLCDSADRHDPEVIRSFMMFLLDKRLNLESKNRQDESVLWRIIHHTNDVTLLQKAVFLGARLDNEPLLLYFAITKRKSKDILEYLMQNGALLDVNLVLEEEEWQIYSEQLLYVVISELAEFEDEEEIISILKFGFRYLSPENLEALLYNFIYTRNLDLDIRTIIDSIDEVDVNGENLPVIEYLINLTGQGAWEGRGIGLPSRGRGRGAQHRIRRRRRRRQRRRGLWRWRGKHEPTSNALDRQSLLRDHLQRFADEDITLLQNDCFRLCRGEVGEGENLRSAIFKAFKKLKLLGINLHELRNSDGKSLLHVSAEFGTIERLKTTFLNSEKFDINIEDTEEQTPLVSVVNSGLSEEQRLKITQIFCHNYGANVFKVQLPDDDSNDDSVFAFLRQQRRSVTQFFEQVKIQDINAQTIKEQGSTGRNSSGTPFYDLLKTKDENGNSVIYYAIINENEELLAMALTKVIPDKKAIELALTTNSELAYRLILHNPRIMNLINSRVNKILFSNISLIDSELQILDSDILLAGFDENIKGFLKEVLIQIIKDEALLKAAEGTDFERIKYLIDNGANVNKTGNDKYGNSVLHNLVASSENLVIIQYLFETKADLLDFNQRNKDGFTAAFRAGVEGHIIIFDFLVVQNSSELGRDEEFNMGLLEMLVGRVDESLEGRVDESLEGRVDESLEGPRAIETIEHLFELNRRNQFAISEEDKNIALWMACKMGKIITLKYFHSIDLDIQTEFTNQNNSLLGTALKSNTPGSLKAAQFLFENGIQLDVQALKNALRSKSASSLVFNTIEDLRDLIETFSGELSEEDYNNLFKYALIFNRIDIAEFLFKEKKAEFKLEYFKELPDEVLKNRDLLYRLMINNRAISREITTRTQHVETWDEDNNQAIKKLLGTQNEMAIEAFRHIVFIRSLFDFAARGNLTMVQKLINVHKIDISIKNEDGFTALHFAVMGRSLDVVKFLLVKGADIYALDNEGHSPMYYADQDQIKSNEIGGQINDLLIERNRKLEEMFAAASAGEADTVYGFSFQFNLTNVRDREGRDLLDYAIENNDVALVKKLFKDDDHIIPKDKHFMAAIENPEILRLLLLNKPLTKDLIYELINEGIISVQGEIDFEHIETSLQFSGTLKSVMFQTIKDLALIECAKKYQDLELQNRLSERDAALLLVKMKQLIENDADMYTVDNDRDGQTILFYINLEKHFHFLNYLVLEKNYDISRKCKKGFTIAYHAATMGYVNTLTFLVNQQSQMDLGIDIDYKNASLIGRLCQLKNLPMLRLIKSFIEEELLLPPTAESVQESAFFSAQKGFLGGLIFLAEHFDFDITQPLVSAEGLSLLATACVNDQKAVVAHLLLNEVSLDQTVFDMPPEELHQYDVYPIGKSKELALILLKKFPEFLESLGSININNAVLKFLVKLAIENNLPFETIYYLINKEKDFHQRKTLLTVCLQTAIEHGNTLITQKLIKVNASVTKECLLDQGNWRTQTERMQMLLNVDYLDSVLENMDLEPLDIEKLIFIASYYGSLEIVEFLVSYCLLVEKININLENILSKLKRTQPRRNTPEKTVYDLLKTLRRKTKNPQEETYDEAKLLELITASAITNEFFNLLKYLVRKTPRDNRLELNYSIEQLGGIILAEFIAYNATDEIKTWLIFKLLVDFQSNSELYATIISLLDRFDPNSIDPDTRYSLLITLVNQPTPESLLLIKELVRRGAQIDLEVPVHQGRLGQTLIQTARRQAKITSFDDALAFFKRKDRFFKIVQGEVDDELLEFEEEEETPRRKRSFDPFGVKKQAREREQQIQTDLYLMIEEGFHMQQEAGTGKTSLHYAVETGNFDLLLQIYSSRTFTDYNTIPDANGDTPFTLAFNLNSLGQRAGILNFFLKNLKYNPNEREVELLMADEDYHPIFLSRLFSTSDNYSYETIKRLLENEELQYSERWLNIAKEKHNWKLVGLLLAHKSEINSVIFLTDWELTLNSLKDIYIGLNSVLEDQLISLRLNPEHLEIARPIIQQEIEREFLRLVREQESLPGSTVIAAVRTLSNRAVTFFRDVFLGEAEVALDTTRETTDFNLRRDAESLKAYLKSLTEEDRDPQRRSIRFGRRQRETEPLEPGRLKAKLRVEQFGNKKAFVYEIFSEEGELIDRTVQRTVRSKVFLNFSSSVENAFYAIRTGITALERNFLASRLLPIFLKFNLVRIRNIEGVRFLVFDERFEEESTAIANAA